MAPLFSTEDLDKVAQKCYGQGFSYGYECGWNDAIKSVLDMIKGKTAEPKEEDWRNADAF